MDGNSIANYNIKRNTKQNMTSTGTEELRGNAEGIYNQTLPSSQSPIDFLMQKASDLTDQGRYEEAIETCDEVIKINPKHADAWYTKGLALAKLGKYEEAINAFKKFIEIKPEVRNYMASSRIVYMNREPISIRKYIHSLWSWGYNAEYKLIETIETCDEAIKINPKHADAWYTKGLALAKLGMWKYNKAIKAYDKAIEINPDFADAWNNKIAILLKLGKYEEAIKTYYKAGEIAGEIIRADDTNAWYKIGVALANLEKYEEAIEVYNKAIKINPDFADAWNNKGLTLANLGKYEEAIEAYNKAIKINPDFADAWNNKGLTLANLGKYEEAIEAYNKAIKINPDFADAYNNKGAALLGAALLDLGKYDEAIRAYRKATELDSKFTGRWYSEQLGKWKVLFNFPILKRTRKIYEGVLIAELKDRIKMFSLLNSISTEEKSRIRPRVAESIRQVAPLDAGITFKKELILKPFFKIWMFSFIFFPVLWLIWFHAGRSVSELSLLVTIAFFVYISAFITLGLIVAALGQVFWIFGMFFIYILIVTVLITMEFRWIPKVVYDGLAAGLFGFLVVVGTFIFIYWLFYLINKLIMRSKNHRYPEAEMINLFCKSLNLVEGVPNVWRNANIKNNLFKNLEFIALIIENDLPRQFHCQDAGTDIWLKNHVREIGAGIRQLKKHVLMPTKESRERLRITLSARLVNAADRNWGLFDLIESPSVPLSWRFWASNTLRILIVIAFPLLILGIIKVYPIELPDKAMESIVAISISWVALNILTLLDPEYQKKLSSLNDLQNLIGRK